MKKFFRVALVCALAGATLLYTSCTKDYSEDLHQLTQRLEKAELSLTPLPQQVQDLIKAKDELEKADEAAMKLIENLMPRVDSLAKDVQKLQEDKDSLLNLIENNASDISKLKDSVNTIDGQITHLNGEIGRLEGLIGGLQTTVDGHKARLDSLDSLLALKADQTYVDTELEKKADKTWVTETLENYALVKSLVDTAAVLRGEINMVNFQVSQLRSEFRELGANVADFGARLNRVADSVKLNADAVAALGETVRIMGETVSGLSEDMRKAKLDIIHAQETADNAAIAAGNAMAYAKGVERYLKENYYTIGQVDREIAKVKSDFSDSLKKKLDVDVWTKDTARINAQFKVIDEKIAEVIRGYKEGDEILNKRIDSLDQAINALLDLKLDKTTFNEYVEKTRQELDGIQRDLKKVIARVQSLVYVPEYDDNRITLSWAQMYPQNMFDTRKTGELPDSFDEEAWKTFLEELFGPMTGGIERELAGLIYGNPDVGRIIFPDYPFFPQFGGFPTPEQYESYSDELLTATPIVEPTHVKYRVYGEDADDIVESLVAAVKEGKDLLSFDVVRVKTRVNKDEVALKIVDAQVDDLFEELGDASVIDLTVVPENLPSDFWLYTWDVKNFMNPKTHQLYFAYLFMTGRISQELYTWLYKQYVENAGVPAGMLPAPADGANEPAADLEEEDAEFPAFSVSLVLTDEEESRLITSAYNNVVPAAQSDEIELWIRRGDEDVTYRDDDHEKGYLDTVEIAYIDLSKHDLLGNTELMFTFKGEDYTAEEFEALGMNLGDPQARFFVNYIDYDNSIAAKRGEDLPEDYFVNTSDDDAPVAYANLKQVISGGVGAYEVVELVYFVGPASVWTSSYVVVTPVKLSEVVDIWETKDLQPFTWNYTKDAAVDAAIFRGENPEKFYCRDSAVAVYDEEKMAADFEKYDISFADFEGKTPNPDTTFFFVLYEDGHKDTVKLADLLEEQDPLAFNIYPFFDSEDNGALKANVTNFFFRDLNENEEDNHGAVKEISYIAIYNLPDDEQPAIEVTVTGKIVVADRDRSNIIVNLPETFEPFVVNYSKKILDTLYNDDHALQPEFPAGTYAAHSLTDDDLLDAYSDEHPYTHTDSLTMTVEGDVITKFAEVRIVTTVDEEHDGASHILDYKTNSNFNVSWTKNKVIEPYQTFQSIDTLWYGQVVIVNKTVRLDVDGIFEFERIPEYVGKKEEGGYWVDVQPYWSPDGATVKPYDVPVNGYEAKRVKLNEDFRIVDVLASIEAGEKVVATVIGDEVEGLNPGDLLPDYQEILARIFKLEEPGVVGEEVDFIADPRAEAQPELIDDLNALIAQGFQRMDPQRPAPEMGVSIDEDNVVSYYSESDQEDAVGKLYAVNSNGSMVLMTTNFNRGDAEPSPRLAEAGVVVEDYSDFVIKKFDPIYNFVAPAEVQRININNAETFSASIYQFLSMLDLRGFELIDPTIGDGRNGWVIGNASPVAPYGVDPGASILYPDGVIPEDAKPNGFEFGVESQEVRANVVYSILFDHELEYVDEVSPETQARIKFDPETGVITFRNTHESQLNTEIKMYLTIKVEYPWNTKTAAVNVVFYNEQPSPEQGN